MCVANGESRRFFGVLRAVLEKGELYKREEGRHEKVVYEYTL
jgi:hypothetical protein